MATGREAMARQLQQQIQMQVRGWEAELERLKALDVPARIAELEALITEFKNDKDVTMTLTIPAPVAVVAPSPILPSIKFVEAVPSPAPVTRG